MNQTKCCVKCRCMNKGTDKMCHNFECLCHTTDTTQKQCKYWPHVYQYCPECTPTPTTDTPEKKVRIHELHTNAPAKLEDLLSSTDTAEKCPHGVWGKACATCFEEDGTKRVATTDTSDKEPPIYMVGATEVSTSDLDWEDTSGWRERFDQAFPEFGYPKGTRNDRMIAFIANELEKARAAGWNGAVEVSREVYGYNAGRAEERARLREVIEGMKMKQRHVECENGKAETCDICFFTMSRNQVLSDLLDTLKD